MRAACGIALGIVVACGSSAPVTGPAEMASPDGGQTNPDAGDASPASGSCLGSSGNVIAVAYVDGPCETSVATDAGVLTDAAALCPAQESLAVGKCPEEAALPSLVCSYPSSPCPNKYHCQCVEGLGGPSTCSWDPSVLACADAGDAAD